MSEEININYWVNMSSLTFIELAHLLADECPPSEELGLDDKLIIDGATEEVRNIYRLLCRASDDRELKEVGGRIKPLLQIEWLESRKGAFPKGERFLKALSDISLVG